MQKRTASEIIDFILNDLNIKAPTFAANINVSYSRIFDIQREKTKKISAELANKIVSKYPKYNITWIISGEGDIYRGTLEERLDKYLQHKGIPLDDFLGIIKMTGARYILVSSSNIRKDELDRIYKNYPDLNPDWLLEGRGEMLRENKYRVSIGDNNHRINVGIGSNIQNTSNGTETTPYPLKESLMHGVGESPNEYNHINEEFKTLKVQYADLEREYKHLQEKCALLEKLVESYEKNLNNIR